MPESDGADSGTDDSSPDVNGSIHFESSGVVADTSVNQVAGMEDERSDYQDDGKVGEDAGKDEFVDASEELNADNRDSSVAAEDDFVLDDESSPPKNNPSQMENGDSGHYLMDEIRQLQDLLDKTISEKESAAREYEEERERCTREISDILRQIKGQTYQQEAPENEGLSADHYGADEYLDGKEQLEVSVTSLYDMIRKCSKLIGCALEERSEMEVSTRELHATFHIKDQQIDDLNSKIAELSAAQSENYQHLEYGTRRMLDSLAFVAEHEELLDDSVGERMNLIERRTNTLIEKYSNVYYQIDQLRQCLPEAGPELFPEELDKIISGVCNELLEGKRKETDLVERLKMIEFENEKLVEQLNQDKVSLAEGNVELGRVRMELEQEKVRVTNVKEKLSMAVTKGKSLVQQRDSLKQTLADKTNELERCLIDLKEKSEALEATKETVEELRQNESLVALLQENLSQRNTILMKFEEVLSEASLPEEVQLLDITEKCRWIVAERKSLRDISMEYLKCKNALSPVNLPDYISGSDFESVIIWLKESFYQASNRLESLQSEVSKTRENAKFEIERISASLATALQEKVYLENELAKLKLEYEEIVEKENHASSEKMHMARLLIEKFGVAAGDPGCNYEGISHSDYVTLIDLCFEKMRENIVPLVRSPAELELFESIKDLLFVKDLDLRLCEKVLEEEILTKTKETSSISNELNALSVEIFALKEERGLLQKNLEHSEEKSVMLRDKLSLAVKKGKGLVQDRENLKNLLDEKNREIERLKLELQQQESVVTDCKDDISRMYSLMDRIPVLEMDLASVKEQKDKLEQLLLERGDMLERMMESVNGIEIPPGVVAEEPTEKINWLIASIIECQNAKYTVEKELDKVREEAGNISVRFAEAVAAVEKMHVMEEDFEKVKEEANILTSQLREAQATIKTLEDELSDAQNIISQLAEERREIEIVKMNTERDLQEAQSDASVRAASFAEECTIRKSLEDALSNAENNISLLTSEREAAQVIRVDLETERGKMEEVILDQNTKLEEAQETIESLEKTISELHANVALLNEDRSTFQNELKKLQDEIGSKSSLLMDALENIRSLESALAHAENHVSLLENENKISNEEISELKSKLSACFEESAGNIGNLENRSLQGKDCLESELANLKLKYEEIVEKENHSSSEKKQMIRFLIEKSGFSAGDHGFNYELLTFSDCVTLVDQCFEKMSEMTIPIDPSPAELELFESIKDLLYVKDLDLVLCEKVLDEESLTKSKEVSNMSNELNVLLGEIFALKEERGLLQKDLERSEEKSAMLREKLSLAVKKGKGLFQDRENLKNLLDEKNGEIEKLKLEIQQQESVVTNCKDEMCKMSSLVERIPVLEADLASMKDQKDNLEQFLFESNDILQRLIESVEGIEVPPGLIAEKPAKKIKWLIASFLECQNAKYTVEQELDRVREEAGNISVRFSEAVSAIEKMHVMEEDFEKVKEEASNLIGQLRDAQGTIKTLEDELSATQISISHLAEERKEIEIVKLNAERDLQEALNYASFQANSFAEACTIRKSLEDALSHAENNISLLTSEKEAAQALRVDLETERQKMEEVILGQNTKLGEAQETIKSLEKAISELQASVDILNEDKSTLQNELKKLQDETGSKSTSLMDALENIKTLEGALSQAENRVSILENENKMSNQEISELKSKLSTCMEELGGNSGNLEDRSSELFGCLDKLEVLVKDKNLFSTMKKDFQNKFERLKDMDLILNNMKSLHSEQVESELFMKGGSFSDQLFSGDLGESLKFDEEYAPMNTVDGDKISLSLMRTVEWFHWKDKIIVDKYVEFSTFMDEFLSALFRKLEGRQDEVRSMLEDMDSLTRVAESAETHKLEQQKAISVLEDAATLLLSACAIVTKELQFEAENDLLSFVSIPVIEIEESGGFNAGEYRKKLDGSKYIKPAEDLLYAATRARGLMKQFVAATKAAAMKIENLENELTEAKAVSQKALEDGDTKQNLIYNLEKDVEALEKLCSSLKFKVEDCQANFHKLKEREAEMSSNYNELLLKQQETEDMPLSPSQWRTLTEKIIETEIPSAEIPGSKPVSNSSYAEKLFYILDSFTQLQNQVHLLIQDREELQSNLAVIILENKHLKDEVEMHSMHAQYSENTKNDLTQLISGLEKMASRLGISETSGEQKAAGVNALLAALEKQIMNVLLEFEASKSRTQELGSKLAGSQKVIDELSAKVKLFEGSLQGTNVQPDVIQEQRVFETASVPPESEISEIEVADSSGKSLMSAVPSAAHVRTMRKGSMDHLALNIDSESQHLIKTESDDEKGHKFKSLITTGLIPNQGKLIADRIDGICVNGGRILMNRPGARLGLIAYWLFLHVWLLGTLL